MDSNFASTDSGSQLPDDQTSQPVSNEELLRRVIRLAVGLALVLQDALRRELPGWEAEAAERLAELERSGMDTANEHIISPSLFSRGDFSESDTPWFPKNWEYRLVGLAFASPKYLRSAFSTVMRAPKSIWQKTAPLRLPLDWLGVTGFTHDWLENIADQISDDLERIERIGREEALPSRGLAYVAVLRTYEMFFHNLAQNPEVKDLIQQQSVGLTTEMVEEVRERAVSLDIVTDALMRRLLGLKPTRPSPHSPEQLSTDDERDPSW